MLDTAIKQGLADEEEYTHSMGMLFAVSMDFYNSG
jgi:hypothetical protein